MKYIRLTRVRELWVGYIQEATFRGSKLRLSIFELLFVIIIVINTTLDDLPYFSYTKDNDVQTNVPEFWGLKNGQFYRQYINSRPGDFLNPLCHWIRHRGEHFRIRVLFRKVIWRNFEISLIYCTIVGQQFYQ